MAAPVTGPAPAAAARRPLSRRLGFAAAGALLLLLVLGAALELGARLFWELPPAMADFRNAGMYRRVGDSIELVPGYRGELRIDAAHTTRITVDPDGLRSNGTVRPNDALRVLCAGDSLVFGYGVEDHETWPAVLQRELQQRLGRPVAAGNAGVPAYGTTAVAACIERRVPSFHPDAVVFAIFLGNDVPDDCSPQLWVEGGILFPGGAMAELMRTSFRARVITRSRFWLWFETWLWTNHPQHSPLAQVRVDEWSTRLLGFPRERTDKGLFLDVLDEGTTWSDGGPPVIRNALATMRRSLQRARAAAGSRPLLVLVQPTLAHLEESVWRRELERLGFDPGQFAFGLMRARIRSLAEELGLPVLDVHDVFAGAVEPAALFLPDQGHFSVRGNALVGAAVADALARALR